MSRNRISSERVVAVIGLVFLIVAAIVGLMLDGAPTSVIEKVAPTSVVIPAVHFICVGLAIVFLITQNTYIIIAIL